MLKNNCPHIIVGTLGRIRALARDKDPALKNVRHFILDECDKMLEPDAFLGETFTVAMLVLAVPAVPYLPGQHYKTVVSTERSGLEFGFGCTCLVGEYNGAFGGELNKVFNGGEVHYIKLSELEKNHELNDPLDALDFNQVVIFVKSMRRAAEVNELLVDHKFPSVCIYYGMSQEERYLFHVHITTMPR
ncbi:hypothetical protein MRB53_006711 [Persea americana]|uniref:Uncharacterized protein n=1 Tax=Persea americana TaxID=3435 RepID=A0ACC2MH55_PERAE|nr:hypothetical protein MRB53_006711 [Persea americana]